MPNYLASAVYLHNLIYGEMSLVNGVAWSLEIEVQFYVLAPLIAFTLAIPGVRLRRGVLLGLIGCLMLLKATVFSHLEGPLALTVLWYFDLFLVGFLLADWYTLEGRTRPASLSGDVAAVLGLAGVLGSQLSELGQHLIALPVAVSYWGVFRSLWVRWLLSRPFFVVVGGMCYTIYLYHFFIISAVGRATLAVPGGTTFAGNFLVQAALILPVVLAASAVLFLLFEKPFMKPGRAASLRSIPSQA